MLQLDMINTTLHKSPRAPLWVSNAETFLAVVRMSGFCSSFLGRLEDGLLLRLAKENTSPSPMPEATCSSLSFQICWVSAEDAAVASMSPLDKDFLHLSLEIFLHSSLDVWRPVCFAHFSIFAHLVLQQTVWIVAWDDAQKNALSQIITVWKDVAFPPLTNRFLTSTLIPITSPAEFFSLGLEGHVTQTRIILFFNPFGFLSERRAAYVQLSYSCPFAADTFPCLRGNCWKIEAQRKIEMILQGSVVISHEDDEEDVRVEQHRLCQDICVCLYVCVSVCVCVSFA